MFAAGSLDQHQDGQGLLLEYNRPASRAPRQQLARILIAYAALDSTVSYCQGMSSVAGMLLLAGIPEEMVRRVLVAMHVLQCCLAHVRATRRLSTVSSP